jgi:fluoride exporter
MLTNILLVIISGGVGSVCRYLLGLLEVRWFGAEFAWGTLTVNLAGSLLIGFCYALMERNIISPELRLFSMTGFLGGLTTFSSFALQTINLVQNGQYMLAFINFSANNMGGLLLVLIGIFLGRQV